ncbi:MAG: hypothetical protein GF401_16955 [Chitinivibrionales bacterium]|nr:hypothetical protein [Chitinivibrionales bacterium]
MSTHKPCGAFLIRLRILILAAGSFAALFLSCNNPFFPPLGTSRESGIRRNTPEGLLDQLENAYTTQRIALFEDLFSDSLGFKYYVPHSVISSLEKLGTRATYAIMGEVFTFIDSGDAYEYITYTDEIAIHRNLFRNADEIIFSPGLTIDSVAYTLKLKDADTLYSRDSSGAIDSSTFDIIATYDTVQAEVRTLDGAKISVHADELRGTVEFDIGEQVFVLQRDPSDNSLWVVAKWFELPEF